MNKTINKAINTTTSSILINTIRATVGLFFFGVGVYLTIQAGIGVAPWDAFNLGLAETFNITYGTASILVSFAVIIVDVLLKEQIGIGMILDAVVVGKTVDLCNYIHFTDEMDSLWTGIPLMLLGFVIMGFSQYLYMSAGLGCGPRDSLLVALKKRFKKTPIGAISICMLAIVVAIGWSLGGPIGIGTLMAAFCIGPIMQADFAIIKFVPEYIVHQNLLQSLKIITGKQTIN